MKNLISAGILALTSSLSIAAPEAADLHPLTSLSTQFFTQFGFKVNVGYGFHVNEPLLVNAIGSSEFGYDGRGHGVFLWNSSGDLLFEGDIGSADNYDPSYETIAGSYKYIDFKTVLPVGDYVIGGWGYGGRTVDSNGAPVSLPLTYGAKPTSSLITITSSGYNMSGNPITPSVFSGDIPELASGYVTLSAVAAVPEPSTYAMLFAGLAMIGGLVRRRRQ